MCFSLSHSKTLDCLGFIDIIRIQKYKLQKMENTLLELNLITCILSIITGAQNVPLKVHCHFGYAWIMSIIQVPKFRPFLICYERNLTSILFEFDINIYDFFDKLQLSFKLNKESKRDITNFNWMNINRRSYHMFPWLECRPAFKMA